MVPGKKQMGLSINRGIILGFSIFIAMAAMAQKSRKPLNQAQTGILNLWKIEILGGATSYFGDLSLYDLNPIGKLANESQLAVGLRISKSLFNDKLELGGQLLNGGFKGDYSPSYSFSTSIFEYNLQFRVNLSKVVFPGRKTNYGLSFFAGAGQFVFSSRGGPQSISIENGNVYRSRVPEFVYFFGGLLNRQITDIISLNLELSIRQAQNDYLDLRRYGSNYDYYSFFGVGLSIYIEDISTMFSNSKSCEAYDSLHREPFK